MLSDRQVGNVTLGRVCSHEGSTGLKAWFSIGEGSISEPCAVTEMIRKTLTLCKTCVLITGGAKMK